MSVTHHVIRAYADLRDEVEADQIRPMSGGLINDTYAVERRWVLQRLHPIFAAEVNLDIAALTPHLLEASVSVPTILLTDAGLPWVEVLGDRAEGAGVWRVMTRLPGQTLHRLRSAEQATSAAALVARFHGGLSGVQHRFHFTRPGAHDTLAHLQTLKTAIAEHREHRFFHDVETLSAELHALWREHGELLELPQRIGHGDLKVSNLLFGEGDAEGQAGEAESVLDLDTMAWMTLDAELGDALRSWCNASREDDAEACFEPDIFAAAVRGYGADARRWLTEAERHCVVPGLIRISLELSARFAADALKESYFGWDPSVAPTRGAHNLLRARNQLALAKQVIAVKGSLSRLCAEALRG